MLHDITILQELESKTIAPYAVHSGKSRGRRHPEKQHPFRTDFQRDRDRVLHSHAFRRLEYKTQVFLSGSGDHLRNRLTHTIEVAAIARTMARALAANEDLTEAIALAHDLGHTPFGHAGERALHKLMKNYGGFDHNLQALRVVDLLEIKYPDYNGINLTWELRNGLLKHRGSDDIRLDGELLPPNPSLEAQIADLADDLTYYGHDVDDGLDAGLLTEEMLERLELWRMVSELAKQQGLKPRNQRFAAYAVRCLIDSMVGNAIRNSGHLLEKAAPESTEEVQNATKKMVAFSPDFEPMTLQLKDFLYKELYFGKELEKLNDLAYTRMEFLFHLYLEKPSLMGETARGRIEENGIHRAAADYIAGMTDNFLVTEYLRLHP